MYGEMQRRIESLISEENKARNVRDFENGEFFVLKYNEQYINSDEEECAFCLKNSDQDQAIEHLKNMRDTADNRAFRQLYSCRKYIGKLIVFCKRIVRKCLKWYIEPICDQQSDFNRSALILTEKILSDVMALNTQLEIHQSKFKDLKTCLLKYSNLDQQIEFLQNMLREKNVELAEIQKQVNSLNEQQKCVASETSERIVHLEEKTHEAGGSLSLLREKINMHESRLEELQSNIGIFTNKIEVLDDKIKDTAPKYIFGDIMSSSQSGEDTIVAYILDSLKIPFNQCTYLDLGANHYKYMSNSYMFYRYGARGVLVEANPRLIPELKENRPGDVILNRCVTVKPEKNVDFFILNGDGLSAPDYLRVKECIARNPALEIEQIITVETITLDEILKTYFREPPILVSIDIEGNEVELLSTLVSSDKRPLIIIVENSLPYACGLRIDQKNKEILQAMESMGYGEYAFTGINFIFVDKNRISSADDVGEL